MLDIKRIRENYEEVKAGVEKRGKGGFGIERVRELDIRRREILAEVEALKNKQNVTSREVPKLKKAGEDTTALFAEMKQLSARIKELDGEVAGVEEELSDVLLGIPNTPYKDVQIGADQLLGLLPCHLHIGYLPLAVTGQVALCLIAHHPAVIHGDRHLYKIVVADHVLLSPGEVYSQHS